MRLLQSFQSICLVWKGVKINSDTTVVVVVVAVAVVVAAIICFNEACT